MVTGIVIPHELRVAFFEHQFGALADYQAAVGGYVEPVYLADAHLTMYANEEGKVHQLPVNRRATCLWWLLHPEMRGRDILVGDVVLIGSTRGHGSTTALPDFLARQLHHPGRFTIEVRTNADPAHWYDNGRYFDNFFEAAIGAIDTPGAMEPDPRSARHACVTTTPLQLNAAGAISHHERRTVTPSAKLVRVSLCA